MLVSLFPDPVGDEGGLVALILAVYDRDLVAPLAGGEEILVATEFVVSDERVGDGEYGGGGTEVLSQRDDASGGVVLLELEDVGDVGAAPAVDRLVRIAHDAEVWSDGLGVAAARRERLALPGHERGERELGVVGVLVLVDHEVSPAVVAGGEDLGSLAQHLHAEHEQVVEVDGVCGAERGLVAVVHLCGDAGIEIVGASTEGVGIEQVVLGGADPSEHGPRGEVAGRELEILDDALDEGELVGGIIDGKVGAQAGQIGLWGVAPQQAGAQGVKRGDREPARARGLAVEECGDAVSHFSGGLVGEGHGEDLPRGDADGDEAGDAVCDDPGFAAACGGEYEQRPLGVEHGLSLRVGESFQQRVGRGLGGHALRIHSCTARSLAARRKRSRPIRVWRGSGVVAIGPGPGEMWSVGRAGDERDLFGEVLGDLHDDVALDLACEE